MRELLGKGIIAIGILVVIAGLAAPTTSPRTATTCYDNPATFGDDCVRVTYDSPNTGRFGQIGFGIFVVIVGAVLAVSVGSKTPDTTHPAGTRGTTESLVEQVKSRQRNDPMGKTRDGDPTEAEDDDPT